ncbi:MAG: CDF family Co(II)/Ni(II) efflux transporter DmeF [Lautropia sp.]|nr:CDF family Co(II)/Ni(II) efflux transporter DmeF [Lautropia sp.]
MASDGELPLDCRLSHVFSEGNPLAERRTRWVMWLTLIVMVAEIGGGWLFNSMALLADGWHMSSHALALGLAVFAYRAARYFAQDRRFAFGTWKIEILGGYTSALMLIGVAILMLWQSVARLVAPLPIGYDQAIGTAFLGLAVNLISAFMLKEGTHGHHHHGHAHGPGRHHADHDHDHGHGHNHDHDNGHDHGAHGHPAVRHSGPDGYDGPVRVEGMRTGTRWMARTMGSSVGQAGRSERLQPSGQPVSARGRVTQAGHRHADLNLRAAYLHVMADAATSVLAIVALFGGKFWGADWLDPLMGIAGAVLVAVWAKGLLLDCSRVLLDAEMDDPLVSRIRCRIDRAGLAASVSDLHVWRVSHQKYACIIALTMNDSDAQDRDGAGVLTSERIHRLLAGEKRLVHLTVEVNAPVLAVDHPGQGQ